MRYDVCWGIMLRPPVEPMRARPIPHLPDLSRAGFVAEPKWDGWRAVAFVEAEGVVLQSRAGRPLHPYFPDVCRHLVRTVPVGTVVDGELVAWEVSRTRTSFGLLQRRVTAGRRLVEEIRQHPAHLVVFDLLQEAGTELLRLPLAQRRARLAHLLTDGPPQLPLCPQTTEQSLALAWHEHGADIGVEGLVVKALAGGYRLGRADWFKIRKRAGAEAVVGGVIGRLTDPLALLLGRFDPGGRLRYVGSTVALPAAQRRELGVLLPVAAWRGPYQRHPWPYPLPAAWTGQFDRSQPIDYVPVEPVIVVEVSADVAWEHGRWRHPLRLLRARLDLEVPDVTVWTS